MGKSQRVTASQAAQAVRIAWEAAELSRRPAEQGRHIVDCLSELVGTDFGFWCVIDDFIPGRVPNFRHAAVGSANPEELAEYFARAGKDFPATDDPAMDLGRYVKQSEVLFMTGLIAGVEPATHINSIDIMKRAGTQDALIGITRRPELPSRVNALALHRTVIRRKHDEREQQITQLFLDESEHLHLLGRLEPSPQTAFDVLTPRQQQVAQLMLTSSPQKEMAAMLCLSQHTLSDHVKNVYRRLGVTSRAEFMARYGTMPPCSHP